MTANKYYNGRHLNLHLCKPGCWADNELPRLNRCNIAFPHRLISFKECLTSVDYEAGVHFFIDDVKFERFWTCPECYIKRLSKFACVLTPDFSVYNDVAIPVQHWNVYRSRVLGMYLQNNGVNVIPTIPFAGFVFNHYALIGLPLHSTVAVSTVGSLRNRNARKSFQSGIDTMVHNLQPSGILVYGDTYGFDFHNIKVKNYDKFRFSTDSRK